MTAAAFNGTVGGPDHMADRPVHLGFDEIELTAVGLPSNGGAGL